MDARHRTAALALATSVASVFLHAACDGSSAVKEAVVDAGAPEAGSSGGTSGNAGEAGAKDCFDDPKTHFEIINACTDATGIAKDPTLRKLLPDGGLPPLS